MRHAEKWQSKTHSKSGLGAANCRRGQLPRVICGWLVAWNPNEFAELQVMPWTSKGAFWVIECPAKIVVPACRANQHTVRQFVCNPIGEVNSEIVPSWIVVGFAIVFQGPLALG